MEIVDKDNIAQGFLESLYYQIKLTEKCSKMLAKQLEAKLDLEITLDELTALGTISLYNGEIHQRDLAQIMLKDRANTGRMLDSLEERGYIERIERTKNKRQSHIINLTEKGQQVLYSLTKILKPMLDNVHSKMNYDKEYIKNGLKELRELMKQEINIEI